MVDFKRNFIFAAGVLVLLTYFFAPSFYQAGDPGALLRSRGAWAVYFFLAIAIQVLAAVFDGIGNRKRFSVVLAEIVLVIPLSFVVTFFLISAGVQAWHHGTQQASDYQVKVRSTVEKRNHHGDI